MSSAEYAMRQCKIRDGWMDSGKTGVVLYDMPAKDHNGMNWTAVLWDDDEDPDFCKTSGLLIETDKQYSWRILKTAA